jgi:hypothetical protein
MSLPQGLGSKVSEGAVGELYKGCVWRNSQELF